MSALDKTGLEAATVAVHFAADDKDGTLAEAAVAAYLEAVATTSAGVTEEQTPRAEVMKALKLVDTITPESFRSFSQIGCLADWCEVMRRDIRAGLHLAEVEERKP